MVVLCLFLSLCCVLTGPVLAQSTPTPKPSETKEKYDNKDDLCVSGICWDLGDFVDGIMHGFSSIILSTFNSIIKDNGVFAKIFFAVPTPGDPLNPISWFWGWKKANSWWNEVYGTYAIMAMLSLPLLFSKAMMAMDEISPRERNEQLVEVGKAFVFGSLFGLPMAAFILHVTNEVAMAMVPDHFSAIFGISGIAATALTLGGFISFFIVLLYAIILLVGILVSFVQHVMIYFLVAFWPLMWAFRVQQNDLLQHYGNMGLSLFSILVMINFFQSSILYFITPLISLDDASMAVASGAIVSELSQLIVLIGGLVIALIILPIYFLTEVADLTDTLSHAKRYAVGRALTGIDPTINDQD